MRKVPVFVPASPWGLRLPQKFLFLLFLSGLVTLCFGALFLLPNSSRLKRLFLAPRTQQPGLEAVAQVAGHPLTREQESPPNPAPAAPAPGEDDPRSQASPRRRKGWLRRTRPTGPREEATAARASSATALRPQEGSISSSFDFNAFRSRLRHPVLGTRADKSKEPQSLVQSQREKIKEVRTLLPAQKKRPSCASIHFPWAQSLPGSLLYSRSSRHTLYPPPSSPTSHLHSYLHSFPLLGSVNHPHPRW